MTCEISTIILIGAELADWATFEFISTVSNDILCWSAAPRERPNLDIDSG